MSNTNIDPNMDFDDFFPSKWLTPADVPDPVVVKIVNVTAELMQDGTKKCALHFLDGLKPMLQAMLGTNSIPRSPWQHTIYSSSIR